jgi:hypothetical protein
MISPSTDPVGTDVVEKMAEIGFDYIELSLSDLAALPESAFGDLARRIDRSGIRCEACNNFFPRRIRLTGEQARLKTALEYAHQALDRAARLGAQIIVFGSSGAKNVPEGFSKETAWRQIVELLRQLGPEAAERGLTIVIEPINRRESNKELERIATLIRLRIVQMMGVGQRGHLGGSCSAADIVTALYFAKMRHDPAHPDWPDGDRFLLSKGHSALAQYAALAEC